MYDQLPIILRFQEIDGEIDKLESKRSRIPVELQALDAELAGYREKFQAQNDAREEMQKERRSKDRQLILQQSQLDKYKSQRLSVKTNKEYIALEFEISELEEANSAIEDEILELMISIDESSDEIEVAKGELKTQKRKYKKKRGEFLSGVEKLKQQISKWGRKRSGLSGNVDLALMSKYDSWRTRRGGSLVAIVVGQSCGGCHLTLPPQLINEVRKEKELHVCDSCGRILYWKDEDKLEE